MWSTKARGPVAMPQLPHRLIRHWAPAIFTVGTDAVYRAEGLQCLEQMLWLQNVRMFYRVWYLSISSSSIMLPG